MGRSINFFDGQTSATTPDTLLSSAGALQVFASDAAFVTAKGSAAAGGDIYFNSVTNDIRYYDPAITAWKANEAELNNSTTSDPTADDDSGDGYEVGSIWVNTSTGDMFRCVDATLTAAVWTEIATNSIVDGHITASADVHGVGAGNNVVGTGTAQTLTNKTLTSPDINTPDIDGGTIDGADIKTSTYVPYTDTTANLTTYAALGTHNGELVRSSDELVYYQIEASSLSLIGGSGGGGLDVYHTEDFESTVAADFSTGNNATFLGGGTLDGALADETGSPISGDSSLKYTMGSSSTNDYFASPAITLEDKQKGNPSGMTLYGTYDGDSGDIKVIVYDVTNTNVLTDSADIITDPSNPTRFSFAVEIPSSCASIRYGFQVVTGNSGKILIVDDIEFTLNPFAYKDLVNITDWESYTPTFQGFGTPTSVDFKWRRVGSNMEIIGNFTAGTSTAAEAQATLPNSHTILAGEPLRAAAYAGRGHTTATNALVLITGGDAFLNFGVQGSSTGGLTPQDGNVMLASGQVISFHISVPIEGWTSTSEYVVTPAKSNMTDMTDYTPVTQGLGTITNVDFKYRRVGDCLEIQGKFTSGTTTGAEVQIGLPIINGTQTTIDSTAVPTSKLIGHFILDADTTGLRTILGTGGDTYLNASIQGGGYNGLTSSNGDLVIPSTTSMSFFATVPIEGWTSDAVFLAAVPVLKDKIELIDGVTAPAAEVGKALIYVDIADGDLKVKFGDGHTAVLSADS